MIKINSQFDGGNIEVIDISDLKMLRFRIRNDTNSEFKQWFYFQINGVLDQELNITICQLSTSSYPDGWNGYNICASYDNQNWFRILSNFDGDNLTLSVVAKCNSLYLAYFEPYSYTRYLNLIALANSFNSLVKHVILGNTSQQRSIDLLEIGDAKDAVTKVWIIARQHPGETMASWLMEGLIHRLLDKNDAVSNHLLQKCVFYLVPHMNPDGACSGNLRTNNHGVNLNREWLAPSEDKSPEVYYVRQKMLQTGVDIFFDIHGDESIPYVFTAGCDTNPSFSHKQQDLSNRFIKSLLKVNPDYQTTYGYAPTHFGKDTATMATSWVGHRFDCLAFTLEMPFKDNNNFPDKLSGWSGRRSYLLGQSLLTAIDMVQYE